MLWRIDDWDDAYSNGDNIPRGDEWPQRWVAPSEAFRAERLTRDAARIDLAYGAGARNRFDLFLPDGDPRGLVVFVHGGFWMKLDKSYWSHLAGGANARGWAVAMPSYTLAPKVRIADITREIGAAVTEAAGMVSGPIVLTGHSAGGHLVTRMVSATSPLPGGVAARIAHTLSISGVHDLRPLLRTRLNQTLHIDADEARAESPVLLDPTNEVRLTCWVGAGERSEFIRQNALLANIWKGCGAATLAVDEPDRHHFDVVDGLADPESPITTQLLLFSHFSSARTESSEQEKL